MSPKALGNGLLITGFALLAAAWTIARLGVGHEIAKIPPETRAQMTDFDWIGMEWVARAMVVAAVGLVVLTSAVLIRWRARRR